MADSPVFDRTCSELEERTSLERLEVRGTVRIAVKSAGLEAASVAAAQMDIVLRKVLPGELAARGIDGATGICEAIAAAIAGIATAGSPDRVDAAAATRGRFGG